LAFIQNLCPKGIPAILIGAFTTQEDGTRLVIELYHLPLGSNTITHIHRSEEMEFHISSQERPQTTQMGKQAGSQQTWDNPVFKGSGIAIHFIGMQRVYIPCGAYKQGYIGFG
jgi:hypothetical protein